MLRSDGSFSNGILRFFSVRKAICEGSGVPSPLTDNSKCLIAQPPRPILAITCASSAEPSSTASLLSTGEATLVENSIMLMLCVTIGRLLSSSSSTSPGFKAQAGVSTSVSQSLEQSSHCKSKVSESGTALLESERLLLSAFSAGLDSFVEEFSLAMFSEEGRLDSEESLPALWLLGVWELSAASEGVFSSCLAVALSANLNGRICTSSAQQKEWSSGICCPHS